MLILELEKLVKSQCRGSVETFKQFLNILAEKTQYKINFNAFRKFMRIIKKYAIGSKEESITLQFSAFLVDQASLYFPYSIKANHVD